MAVGLFILLNKKFKKHPYPLIGLALLFESTYFFARYANLFVCNTGMYLFFAYNYDFAQDILTGSKLFQTSLEFKQESLTILLSSWKFITFTSMYVQITANSIIFYDLYLTLNNPFYPRYKRVKWYFFGFFVLNFTIIASFSNNFINNGSSIKLYDFANNSYFINILKIYTLILTLLTLIPVIMVTHRLNKKGTSQDLKTKVLYRHVIYFILYLMMLTHIYYD